MATHRIERHEWHTMVSLVVYDADDGDTIIVPEEFKNNTISAVEVQGRIGKITVTTDAELNTPKRGRKKG